MLAGAFTVGSDLGVGFTCKAVSSFENAVDNALSETESGDTGSTGTIGTGVGGFDTTGSFASGLSGDLFTTTELAGASDPASAIGKRLFARQTDAQIGEAAVAYGKKLNQACQFHDAAIAMGVVAWYVPLALLLLLCVDYVNSGFCGASLSFWQFGDCGRRILLGLLRILGILQRRCR